MANHLVMAGLLDAGDEVIIELPAYEPLLAVARYLGAQIKRFHRNFSAGFQINPDEIKSLISNKTRLIVLSNLHNPTGVLTPKDTLIALAELASAAGARILTDEVYLECLYPASGTKLSSFHLSKTFVATSSLTKAYGLSGLRCGWILAEPELIRRFWRLNDLFGATPAHTSELLSVVALSKLPAIAERAKTILKKNRVLLENFFNEQKDRLDVIVPEFGTIAFPRLKSGDCTQFVQLLRQNYDTSVVPGHFFEMPEHFRIGIGGPTDLLETGLTNIAHALKLTL
jgi:aspartate/methionine/tyrosine aminotransferase